MEFLRMKWLENILIFKILKKINDFNILKTILGFLYTWNSHFFVLVNQNFNLFLLCREKTQ